MLERRVLSLLAVLAAYAAGLAAPAHADGDRDGAERRWAVASPDGRLRAEVRLAPGRPLEAIVLRDGHRVLDTVIGFAAAGRCLPEGFTPAGSAMARRVERYFTPAGKRRRHVHAARELTLRFRRGAATVRVQLRAANDGFAHRSTVAGPARGRVTGECSAFMFPRGTRAWTQRFSASYENPYVVGRLSDAGPGPVGYPVLLAHAGRWTLLSESALDPGQPATHLELSGGELRVRRPHTQSRLARMRTPWRVAVVGSLATIVESDLVDDLAPPAAARDWSWVRPGRVAWSWWSDSASPASLSRQKEYVDYAARSGWEYVLVDEGWSAKWVPELTAYARAHGVGILLWSRWSALATAAQRRRLFGRWRSWGVAGVKLDFMQSDSHARMAWYRDVARAAAAHRLVLGLHGSTAPRGLSRTFPNLLTMEGVQGAESYKSSALPSATPGHNATLPFTRNAIGPMDYTPVTFSASRRLTSPAHELALSVVFASGLQHFADSPESYAARPLAERWLRDVPVAWDDTRLLDGRPGASATIARRAGARWYVGAIRAGAGGPVDLALDFLAPGREYEAWTIEDGPSGELTARSRAVTARDVLRLTPGTSGGYVARFSPLR